MLVNTNANTNANTQTPPPDSPYHNLQDAFRKEWAECRTTIGRFDSILVDLRKVGFTLISGLLSAASFFGFVVPTGATSPPVEARVSAILAIMVLIAVLSAVDNYYEVLLSGAVERALDLENQSQPHVRLTRYLSRNAMKTRAVIVTWALYLMLMIAAIGLGVFAALSANSGVAALLVGEVGVVLVALMALNWIFSSRQVHLLGSKTQRVWPDEPPQ